ncbi:helix-turn-helix domain-containing protein, partial [Actinocorallia lasiicapitis]
MTVKDYVQQLGGAFMFSREAKEFGRTTGVEGFIGPYMRGRAGVLGDVDADVVTAAVGFFPADVVRAAWESVPMPAAEAAAGYAVAAQG